jgi:hypothetical protein
MSGDAGGEPGRGGRHAGPAVAEDLGEAIAAEPRGRHRLSRAGMWRRRAETAWGMRGVPAVLVAEAGMRVGERA